MNMDDKVWRGVHVSMLQTGLNRYQHPKLISSEEHTILVKLPVVLNQVPECYPSIFNRQDYWDQNHVKLPCSEKNVTRDHRRRWDVMREVFTNLLSSQQLEAAILSYNKRYIELWNFSTLHSFFEDALEESESAYFFETLLPKIIELALCLPQLITTGIPLLKQGHRHSLSLSQLQISCLLANAFLCTFPHRNWNKRNSEYSDYPDINFNRLFQCEDASRVKSVHEKFKCIINYFRRVTNSVPTGVVTYSRQFVPNNLFPEWLKSNKTLTKLYVSSSGTIEDDGFALYQVDFANKLVGGGVIGTGCVQEEIRFVTCPELILSRLFTQVLGENEALVVTGCERFNRYRGYGSTFEWDGDYVDETPSDENGRKYCTVIALDALCYLRNPNAQYTPENILRDLNKAYVGFSWGSRRKKEELCAVATGNWGCGVFAGNPQLKSIIQLLAAAEVGRDLAYFTFGDVMLRDAMGDIHDFLLKNAITVGKISKLLQLYDDKKMYDKIDVFDFLKIEALKTEESSLNKEHESTSSSASKTFKIFSTPKLAMNRERSFFYRTQTDEAMVNEVDEEEIDFEVLERLEKQPQHMLRQKDNAYENLLKRNELENFRKLYDIGVPISDADNECPRRNSFEFLDQFKQKMKNNLMKNERRIIVTKKFETTNNFDQLDTEISTKLSIAGNVKIKSDVSGDYELEKDVQDRIAEMEKENEIVQSSVDDDDDDYELKEDSRVKMDETKKEILVETAVEANDMGKKSRTTTPVNRVTLSELSLRLSKSATKKNKSKERNQKRKISDYFNPLTKKSNNA